MSYTVIVAERRLAASTVTAGHSNTRLAVQLRAATFHPKQTLVSGCCFPTDNVEPRLIESIEHRDSKFVFRFWQEPQRPQTVRDFRSDRQRYDRDGLVGEYKGRL